MARKRKDELGSERPFADLTGPEALASAKARLRDLNGDTGPSVDETVTARARERAPSVQNEQAERSYVSGQGPRPSSYTPTLGQAASMARENRDMASGTADINARVDAVRTNQPPNYAGYLQSRGIGDDKIRAARALSGRTNAPTQPAPFIGNRMDPSKAQNILNATENYANVTEKFGEPSGTGATAQLYKDRPQIQSSTVAMTDAQRADPAYQQRAQSAAMMSNLSQQRQAELDAIKQRVQSQKLAEAVYNRGRGVQNRATEARGLRMDRIATSGLGVQDRASVLLDRRTLESGERTAQAGMQAQASQADADRRSAEKIAQTRANAPAGNRGDAENKARSETAKSFDPILKDLGARAGADDADPALPKLYQNALRGQQAIQMGTPFFPGGNIDQWASENDIQPGDKIVGMDANGYPLIGVYETE